MLEVFDKNNIRLGVLQNAYNVTDEQKINAISTLGFSLPYDDPKNDYCQPFNRVRLDGGQLYRILPQTLVKDESGARIYECEHVIATLLDRVLFGYHVIGNIGVYTTDVIRYILSRQSDWVLDQCDFGRQFEYGWEQENLLGALFSVPKSFNEDYIWEYDTNAYPWRISIKRLDKNKDADLYIRNKKNMLKLETESDTRNICTRLYPLGYGEGVNQLGIAEINNGEPYIQSPPEYIDKYGIVERIWIDRRYTNQESLYEAAKTMLAELQEPTKTYIIDYTEINANIFERAEIGKTVEIIDADSGERYKTIITGIKHDYGDITQSTITIANRSTNIAETVADLADRQRIEMTYAQGATQLYAQSLQANADSKSAAGMNFYIPAEMQIINKIMAKIKIESFRAYSKATEAAGNVATSSESGGGTNSTSDYGGSSTETSSTELISAWSSIGDWDSGYQNTVGYAISEGQHNHGLSDGQRLVTDVYGGAESVSTSTVGFVASGDHTHHVTLPHHKHAITTEGHNHRISIPSHNHSFTVANHSHRINIPGHGHEITPGIYRFGSPKGFDLIINGTNKGHFADTTIDIDLTDYLVSDGKIQRGVWQEIAIKPDDLAYISIDLYVQGFVQSRGDKTL